MRRGLLRYLACPDCRKPFKLETPVQQGSHLVSGFLACRKCSARYPIVRGVPRILRKLSGVEERTAAAFGYEWKNFRENYGYYQKQFLSWIRPVSPGFFRGKVVLDAGCGMGRNLFLAGKFGSKDAIGMDLSEAVDAAFDMTMHMPNVHVVQADINHPPFRQCFGYIFSVGVLHHLPDPKAGFDSLLKVLRKGGVISVWVYGKEGNFLIRTLGSFVRVNITSRLPHSLLNALCIPPAFLLHVLTSLVYKPLRLRSAPYGEYFIAIADFDFRNKLSIVFDHLVPPVAYYISRQEIESWFSALGKVVISQRYGNSWRGTGTK